MKRVPDLPSGKDCSFSTSFSLPLRLAAPGRKMCRRRKMKLASSACGGIFLVSHLKLKAKRRSAMRTRRTPDRNEGYVMDRPWNQIEVERHGEVFCVRLRNLHMDENQLQE